MLAIPEANALILKRERSIMGNFTRLSAMTKATMQSTPAAIAPTKGADQPRSAPSISPTSAKASPAANRTFPTGSSFSPRLGSETSLSLKWAQAVAKAPKGMLIQKMDLHPRNDPARMPPRASPKTDPKVPATWFRPRALPLSVGGKTSVRSAAALEKISAPPVPWTSLNTTSDMPLGAMLQRADPTVNTPNPAL